VNCRTKAYVTVGELGVFPAEVPTFAHVGARPRFTRPVAEAIVAAIGAQNRESADSDNSWLEWEGDVLVEHDPQYEDQDDYTPERTLPDEDGRYAVGERFWEWRQVWCDGDAHHGDADDLVTPVAIMKQVKPYTLAGPEPEVVLEDQAYCVPCLAEARAAHPEATVTPLPPL
jgi:hypothetical protein